MKFTIKWLASLLFGILIFSTTADFLQGQTTEGYDARLTRYEYSYLVSFFSVEAQRQELEMAYMNVQPVNQKEKGAVLLLHGKNFSGAYWARTIDSLTSDGYRVIVPGQIGFGKSSKPQNFQFST